MENRLPSYLENAEPRPASARAPWYKNIAPAYAGIFLWFVFWQGIPAGGSLSAGLALPLIALAASAAAACALFYLAPAAFGMKSGFGLTVAGSPLFGRKGGLAMPGLLMGLLQFGWLAVNIYFASKLVCEAFGFIPLWAMIAIEGAAATFIGLKGIKYVAGVSTFLPLIPLAILAVLAARTMGGVQNFDASVFEGAQSASPFDICNYIACYVAGFFATAGAAGADFGSNARNMSDVRRGGFAGIFMAIVLTGGAALLIVAGAYGDPETAKAMIANGTPTDPTNVMNYVAGGGAGKIMMTLLAISAFPSACFASVIAAGAFKTAMPKTNPTLSVSIGGAAATALALSGAAGEAAAVFSFIGASFAPIVGAMCAEYVVAGGKWLPAGENFNRSGWLAWAVGFAVGVSPIPFAPIAAWGAGFAVYFVSEKISRRKI